MTVLSANHVGQKLADGVELREKVDLDCHLHPLGRAFDEVAGIGNTSLGRTVVSVTVSRAGMAGISHC